MIDEERRLHDIGARAGRGERREDGPDTAITPTAAPGQGPVDPAMRALETYLEASLDRLLSGSEASPSGLLVLSAWHEAMPALVHLDPVLEAVDSRVFAVLWLWAREQGRSTVAFPSYDYLIKRTNVQARSTVARSLAILRITRWVTLCRRVRDRSGRYRGNIYALHDEPLGLGSSFYLDPGYMAFLQDATRHHHARVRQVAAAMLQSLGECINDGEDVLATPPLSQADQRLEALSAIRGKGSGNFFGFRHGALSALRSWRWTMENDAEQGDTHRVQNSNSALCSSRYIKNYYYNIGSGTGRQKFLPSRLPGGPVRERTAPGRDVPARFGSGAPAGASRRARREDPRASENQPPGPKPDWAPGLDVQGGEGRTTALDQCSPAVPSTPGARTAPA